MVHLSKAQRKAAKLAAAGGNAAPNGGNATANLPAIVAGQLPANVPTLFGTKAKPVTYAAITAFVNQHGGPNNVQIVPLPTANLATMPHVPFGYNGGAAKNAGGTTNASGGVRATIQNWLLFGVAGVRTYAAIMGAAKPLGHSYKRPICLLALLNGGYSGSSSTWGTAYVALVGGASASVATSQQPTSQPAAQA